MKQKVILITGCSRGIGLSTAELLASKGHIVCACVKTLNNAEKLVLLSDYQKNIFVYKLNLLDEKEINSVVESISSKFGKIDILINNAATILFGPIESVTLEQMIQQFHVNLFGPLVLTQKVIPIMRSKLSGKIVFLGSTSGVKSSAIYGMYAASKFALEAVCHSLAVNLDQWNISISLIELSATKTKIVLQSLETGKRFRNKQDPYRLYTQKSFDFLRSIIEEGVSPEQIASVINNAIEASDPKFRYFATQFAENEFNRILKDPLNSELIEEIDEQKSWNKE